MLHFRAELAPKKRIFLTSGKFLSKYASVMRLLFMLEVCYCLCGSVFGEHTYASDILASHVNAENEILSHCKDESVLARFLRDITEIKPDNFFRFLLIYTCSINENYKELLEICRGKAAAVEFEVLGIGDSKNVETCLYYFEEIYCTGNEHFLNFIAVFWRESRIFAMIDFLKHTLVPSAKELELQKIIISYKNCLEEYERDALAYEGEYSEIHREEWTSPGCPY